MSGHFFTGSLVIPAGGPLCFLQFPPETRQQDRTWSPSSRKRPFSFSFSCLTALSSCCDAPPTLKARLRSASSPHLASDPGPRPGEPPGRAVALLTAGSGQGLDGERPPHAVGRALSRAARPGRPVPRLLACLFACFGVDARLPVPFRALPPVAGVICIGTVPDSAGRGPASGCCVLCPPCRAACSLMSGPRALPLQGRGRVHSKVWPWPRGQASLVLLPCVSCSLCPATSSWGLETGLGGAFTPRTRVTLQSGVLLWEDVRHSAAQPGCLCPQAPQDRGGEPLRVRVCESPLPVQNSVPLRFPPASMTFFSS